MHVSFFFFFFLVTGDGHFVAAVFNLSKGILPVFSPDVNLALMLNPTLI